MDITFKGQHTDVNERFRTHATGKLGKFERMDQAASRVEVEVCVERNPRLASQKERVELTVSSRGPAIRAEAAAEDRYAALDLALAKLESRLRRSLDRRKNHQGGKRTVRLVDLPGADDLGGPAQWGPEAANGRGAPVRHGDASLADGSTDEVPIPADGDPVVVRQKVHHARAMTIDQALLEMELVGHDFYLFRDAELGAPSVVYRRRGYQYGVLRLMDSPAGGDGEEGPGQAGRAGRRGAGSRRSGRPARNGQGRRAALQSGQ